MFKETFKKALQEFRQRKYDIINNKVRANHCKVETTLNDYIKLELKKQKITIDTLANVLSYKRSTLYWKLDKEDRLSLFDGVRICNYLDIDMSKIQRLYREPRRAVASERMEFLEEKMLNRYKGLCYEFYVNGYKELLEGIWEVETVLIELGYTQEELDKISNKIEESKEIID